MNQRELSILEAAQSVFAKYGVSKTTMGDIAEAAGVARQTVYNTFATKNDILRAAVRVEIERCVSKVRADWKTAKSFEERIEIFHRIGPLRWYDVVETYPDLADLLEGLHYIAAEEMQKGKAVWEELFVQMFEQEGIVCVDPDLTHEDLADFLYSTGKSAKLGATSLEQVKRRLHVSKIALLNLVDS